MLLIGPCVGVGGGLAVEEGGQGRQMVSTATDHEICLDCRNKEGAPEKEGPEIRLLALNQPLENNKLRFFHFYFQRLVLCVFLSGRK